MMERVAMVVEKFMMIFDLSMRETEECKLLRVVFWSVKWPFSGSTALETQELDEFSIFGICDKKEM